MDDSTVSYVTTIRGCQSVMKDGICEQLMKTKSSRNGVQKGIFCETCETDLCNSSIRSLAFPVLSIVILMITLKV